MFGVRRTIYNLHKRHCYENIGLRGLAPGSWFSGNVATCLRCQRTDIYFLDRKENIHSSSCQYFRLAT